MSHLSHFHHLPSKRELGWAMEDANAASFAILFQGGFCCTQKDKLCARAMFHELKERGYSFHTTAQYGGPKRLQSNEIEICKDIYFEIKRSRDLERVDVADLRRQISELQDEINRIKRS